MPASGYEAATLTQGGYVLGFTRDLMPAVPASEALSLAQGDLPNDARKAKDSTDGTCRLVWYTSASLAGIGQGVTAVLVELESGKAGDPYDGSGVNTVTYTASPKVDTSISC